MNLEMKPLACDRSRLDLAPEAAGLYAISIGLSHNFADDHEQLQQGMIVYDALHAWCKSSNEHP